MTWEVPPLRWVQFECVWFELCPCTYPHLPASPFFLAGGYPLPCIFVFPGSLQSWKMLGLPCGGMENCPASPWVG